MQRPLAIWITLRSSLWFVPTLVVLVSMAAAHGLVEAETRIPWLSQRELPPLLAFSAEGSRAMLSAIATAMITIAGVAFSITVVTLSLASSQYSPRVLRQFMRNRASQWVLGVFVGIFAFCLTVLPRIRGGDHDSFVPAVAVAAGVLYALAGVGCLIFFIHHVATSIQASCIVSEIAEETRTVAASVYPDLCDNREDVDEAGEEGARHAWQPVLADRSGYVQLIQATKLLRIAEQHDAVVRIERGVGEFVVEGRPIAFVGGPATAAAALAAELKTWCTIYRSRTIEQDVMFGIRQIVDIGLRALSPSLNDPTTATLCVDYLTTILRELAVRRMGKRVLRDEGKVRLIGCEPSFAAAVRTAYGEIRAAAESQPLVLEGILRGLEVLADVVRPRSRCAALAQEGAAIRKLLPAGPEDPRLAEIEARAEKLLARLPQGTLG